MSNTYAGTTIELVDDLPDSLNAAGFINLLWIKGICALHEVPAIMREWAKVSEDLACRGTNTDIKGSSKWSPVSFKLSRLPGDAAQEIFRKLEKERNGVGSFRLQLPYPAGTIYFTAQVSKFSIVDGGGQDTIHTSSVELLIQSKPVFVAPAAFTGPTPLTAAGRELYDADDNVLAYFSDSTATVNSQSSIEDLTLVRYTLDFVDAGQPNDTRQIIVEFTDHDDDSPVVTDTNGTPAARLDASQITGSGSGWGVTPSGLNDIVVSGAGTITTTLYVEDSSGANNTVTI